MRVKLWLAAGAVLLAVALSAGGTLALWTAGASNDDNQFTTGTVVIRTYRDMGDTIPGPMFYTTPSEGATPGGAPGLRPTGYWAPGQTHVRAIFVENRGTLAVRLARVEANQHVGTSRYLAEKLQAKVTTDLGGLSVLASGTLADFIDAPQVLAPMLTINPSPAPRPLYFHVTLPSDADNSYQGLSLRVNFNVIAEQVP